MPRAHLGLGSNLGDRLEHLQSAVDGLRAAPGVEVVAVSAVYETEPVGGPGGQGAYLNAVVGVETDRSPVELLAVCRSLEQAAARVRLERWGPRTLDVDVLLYEGVVSDDPVLTLPHPRLSERGFVLAPLADVCATIPSADHPGVRRTGLVLR